MHRIVWQYRVAPERVAAFERAYGADGDWVQLFRRAPGYRGTTLFRALDAPATYLTVDEWDDRASHAAFLAAHADAYAALDAACEALCSDEVKVAET